MKNELVIYTIKQNVKTIDGSNTWVDIYSNIYKDTAVSYLKSYRKSYPKEELSLVETIEREIEVD